MLNARTVAVLAAFPVALAAGCDVGQTVAKGSGGAGGSGNGGSTATNGSSVGGNGGGTASTSSSGRPSTSTSGTASGTASTTSSGTASGTASTTSSGTTSASSSSTTTSSGSSVSGLHVSGNKLVDNGATVRLLGVDTSGTEYQCVSANAGFFDVGGGAPTQQFVTNLKAWKINAVRVPLNEDCWLGINGLPNGSNASAYQTAIEGYVNLLRQNGLYVIVDLHWNNGGGSQSNGQTQMADLDHAPAFWTGVAGAFKGDQGVVFDLYNEPHDIAWSCWQNGGCQVNGWNVAGMNQLITAVRGTGATNVVMAGGISYSGDLSEWLANKPSDPMGNLAASFHSYNFSNCNTSSCWSSQLQPLAAQVPIITGEMGENDCQGANPGANVSAGTDYINGYMSWADSNGVSYLAWAWNPDFDHCTGPSLNNSGNWTGTSPTSAFGTDFKTHVGLIGP